MPFFRKRNSGPSNPETPETNTPENVSPDHFHETEIGVDGLFIRPGEIADIQFIMKLENAPENDSLVNKWSFMEHSQNIYSDDFYYFIIESDHRDGSLGFMILIAPPQDPDVMVLQRLIINAKARGIGRHFMEFVLQRLENDTHYKKVVLRLKDNQHPGQSTGFWEKLGFAPEKDRRFFSKKHITMSQKIRHEESDNSEISDAKLDETEPK